MEQPLINTHNQFIDFGKHKGERWTRLPVSYLKWMTNEMTGLPKLMAESELSRRGTNTPTTVELSGHAIDRASQITTEWKSLGLHTWLQRMAEEAVVRGKGRPEVFYKGFKFAFNYGNYYPTLKTIMKKEN